MSDYLLNRLGHVSRELSVQINHERRIRRLESALWLHRITFAGLIIALVLK